VEQTLDKKAGRQWQHNIFSYSVAQLNNFDWTNLNMVLAKEVSLKGKAQHG
jgi:hypothetical protein